MLSVRPTLVAAADGGRATPLKLQNDRPIARPERVSISVPEAQERGPTDLIIGVELLGEDTGV